ncbi:hypothetical protein ACOSP7_023529 [Xanthoceras sorbifolium]
MDTIQWHFSKDGLYSVHSGYHLAVGLVPSPSCLDDSSVVAWWKLLWQLRVPSKVKVFLWRASLGWLPVAATLAARGVSVQDRCSLCCSAVETHLHALWECSQLKIIRKGCRFWAGLKGGAV